MLRKARMQDVESIHQLVAEYARQGLMLARSRNMLYECIREFTVLEKDGKFLGAAGLHILWEDLAEIRALAIVPEAKKQGLGRELVNHLVQEAKELGIYQVFALTYQPDFFKKCGFHEVAKEELPQKVWKECINCPQFPNCDESAVRIRIEKG